MFGEGISSSGSLLDAAVQNNIIEKSGSWYSYGKERIGQGRDAAKKFLQDQKDLAQKIDAEVRKILLPERRLKPRAEAAAADAAAAAPVETAAPAPATRRGGGAASGGLRAAAAAREPRAREGAGTRGAPERKTDGESEGSDEPGETKELF
jgi:recombination protein RecA